MAAMQAIESDRKLSKEIVVDALEDALSKAFRKHIETPDAFVRVDISQKNGEIRLFQRLMIVDEVIDDQMEITLKEAQKIKKEFKLDEFVEHEIDITQFGRAAVILAKNVMKQKIREAEKLAVYEEYCDKVEEMLYGQIETVEEKFCLVNLGKAISLMPKNQQMPNERYIEGQRLRVIISEVNKETKGAQVLVSRASATLVKRLFEKEVPEIYQGVIEIKAIAREPGERTKMAVYSHNENIDPIGACIGPKGSRVQVVIDELKGEKIDIFEWSDDESELIKNALAPADILAVIPNPERDGLLVIVATDQLSLAIGKRGKNARLAVKLTNKKIDIRSEEDMEKTQIDWKTIANEHQEAFEKEKAAKREAAQKEVFKQLAKTEKAIGLEDAGVEFTQPIIEEDVISSKPVKKIIPKKKAMEEIVEPKESDLEKAARIAKEKQRIEGINIKEKQEYTSKFENLADASNKSETQHSRPKSKKYDEKEKEERKATFDLNDKDYDLKPIYSEEELKEIAESQKKEEESDWIHDEIDFDEFDEYYDK